MSSIIYFESVWSLENFRLNSPWAFRYYILSPKKLYPTSSSVQYRNFLNFVRTVLDSVGHPYTELTGCMLIGPRSFRNILEDPCKPLNAPDEILAHLIIALREPDEEEAAVIEQVSKAGGVYWNA